MTAIPARDLFPRTTRLVSELFLLYDGFLGQLYPPLHGERIRTMDLIAIRLDGGTPWREGHGR